jgi:ectoine hydroxylase-related dioxygenase (phytanoyl-CoA dioxygenase family)
MFKNHNSWNKKEINATEIEKKLLDLQKKINFSKIPEININNINEKEIYDLFFNKYGTIILKNVYSTQLMDKLNDWSIMTLKESKNDKNSTHRKQKDKFLINDVITRMTNTEPSLLLKTVFNKKILNVLDCLLGFSRIGSCTMHWINPGGKRQQSHVDYPIHVGSGSFWENNVKNVFSKMTKYQINKIMPYYSLQTLIAIDKMDISNGSTEVIPCSHLLENMDTIIHNKEVYRMFEKHFINVTLEKGDVLIFNRRLCHRGGYNKSNKKRNALIIQSVFLWGIGQEIIPSNKIINKLKNNDEYKKMSDEEKKLFLLRIKAPYPIDVKQDS